MTLAVEDDFGGFVAARWPDLEAVALVAAPDPSAARELTTRALASVGGRWDEVLDEGAPTRAARTALLRDIARTSRSRRRTGGAGDGPLRSGGTDSWFHEDDDPVGRALLESLAAETPLARARIAAGVLWECGDHETADLAGIAPGTRDSELAVARGRMLAAHRRALAAEGLSPADWRLDRDLADALGALVAGRPDPPDPAGLVTGRARVVRRRSLLTGAAAVAGAGAAAWWVLHDASSAREPDPTASPTPDGPIAPDDPVWSSTERWPPRGSLSADTGIRTLVDTAGDAGARLLYAEDVAGVRVVVAGVLGLSAGDIEGTRILAWTGAAGTPSDQLAPVALPTDRTEGVSDVVTLAVPVGAGGGFYTTGSVGVGSRSQPAGLDGVESTAEAVAVLVVLTRPTARGATWSPVVHPTANGSVERAWTLVPLDDGVGVRPLQRRPGTAARVRVAGYDGPVAGAPNPVTTTDGQSPEAAASAYVAAATGAPLSSLRSEVVVDAPAPAGVLDAFAMSQSPSGRVRVVHTRTVDGALVRSVQVADVGRSGNAAFFGVPAVVPVRDADEPVVRRLDFVPPRNTRYLVVAPGAAECQLLAVTPAAYPLSKVVPVVDGAALVPIVNGLDSGLYRLVLWDAKGERTYSAVPERGRPLLDLRDPY